MLEDSLSADRRTEVEEHLTAITIYANMVQPVLCAYIINTMFLPPLNARMIFTVGSQCSENFTTRKAVTLIKSLSSIGNLLDSKFIIGRLIPGGIDCCNVRWQNFSREILGWIIFIMIRDKSDRYETLSFSEKWELIMKAARLRNRNNEFVEKLTETRKRMSPSEQKIFDECLKTLADERVTLLQRREAMSDIQDLLKPYEIIF